MTLQLFSSKKFFFCIQIVLLCYFLEWQKCRDKLLYALQDDLLLHDLTLEDVYLPTPLNEREEKIPKLLQYHLDYDRQRLLTEVKRDVATLNADQKKVFVTIFQALVKGEGGAFFIDAPGGTGKTYLMNLLLKLVRSYGHVGLATASTGIASQLLDGGATLHCNQLNSKNFPNITVFSSTLNWC